MKTEKLFKRFIDDHKLPLQNIEDLEYIKYALDTIGKYDEWLEFVDRVKNRFDDNEEKYFEYYANVKESFLDSVKGSVEFIKFNQRNMNEFKIDKPNNLSKNLYTKDNADKYFLSVDLKKANFQALKYCGLFKDYEKWEDLIGEFTDFPELINSKYLRSVLFGQLNPSRHITVETYLVNNLIPTVVDFFNDITEIKLVVMSSDELVFEIGDGCNAVKFIKKLKDLENFIRLKFELNIKADVFRLVRHEFLFNTSKKEVEFFEKWRLTLFDSTLHCIPSTYYLIAYKIFYRKPFHVYDFLIMHDGIRATISEDIESIC
jgi:hypothetical protein